MHVIGVAVISVDGCLTRHAESGVSFASAEDQKEFRRAVKECGATVMGRRTFDAARERILDSTDGSLLRTIVTREPSRYADLTQPGRVEFTAAGPREIVRSLSDRGYRSVAILGGAQIYDLFAAEGLITEWQITVEPRLFGAGTRILTRATDPELTLVEHRLLNANTLLLRYRVG